MMPGLDGFGLLRAIRDTPALRLTPVILLSARAGEEATAEGLGAGANDYIVKPFSARDLLVRVASNLAVAGVAREAHAIEEAARKRLYGQFMQAPFPIAVLRGPRHETELANPSALAAWGKDEGIVGKPIIEGIPELEGQPFLGYLNEVFRTGVAYRARGELARLVRSADGKPEDVYWDFVFAALRDSGGAIDGILVAGFEVTARVRAAQEQARLLASVEASERQFRELVENLPDLAWTARPDGFVDYYNRRWYEYTGTTFEEMQGWGWKSLHDPEKVEAVVERWRHSIDSGEPFEMEYPLRGADGTFRWFLTRVEPLHDAGGRIVRWFGSNTNIDERRRNDDFRETFLGILGHDLRNPLSTIPHHRAGARAARGHAGRDPEAGRAHHLQRPAHATHDRAAPRSDARPPDRRDPCDVGRGAGRPGAAGREDRRGGAGGASFLHDRAPRRRRLLDADRLRPLRAGRLEPPRERSRARRQRQTDPGPPVVARAHGQHDGAQRRTTDRSGVPASALQPLRAK